MKRISTYLLSLLLFSCNNNVTFEPHNSTKKVIYPSDNPAERVVWEQIRFRNPETGKIPSDMRRKEMTFARLYLCQISYQSRIGFIEDHIM